MPAAYLAPCPPTPLTDYYQVGGAIEARLRDSAPTLGLLDVGALASLADALADGSDADQIKRIAALVPRAPAAFVGYDTDFHQFDADGGGHALLQRWLVLLIVKNVAGTAKNAALQAAAGPLLLAVINTLNGWRPDIAGVGELQRIAAPRPAYGPGIGIFPLAFSVPVYLPGANQR